LTNDTSKSGGIKRRAGPEDVDIGRKIRALRLQRGLSQSGLGDGIGLTFQQVQKYEKGTNRVSASRLQRIADLLDVPVTFFYGGMGARSRSKKQQTHNDGISLVQTKGAMRLLRSYGEISSRATKYALVVLAESLRNKDRG
jgi:transcriptional regulator with XRE-family HTH domain